MPQLVHELGPIRDLAVTSGQSVLILPDLRAFLPTAAVGLQTRRMDLEARSFPPAQKASLLAKIRELKSDLTKLKKDFKAAPPTPPPAGGSASEDQMVANRMELFQGGESSSRGMVS